LNKLQQFYILSFDSAYLKRHNYKIKNITLNDARRDNLVISISQSQLVDTIFEVSRNSSFSKYELETLWKTRARLRRKKHDTEVASEIAKLSDEIDKTLFIQEIVSITFEHVAHYKKSVKDGIIINGKKYVRLMAGAGHLRRKTVLFVRSDLQERLLGIFENGINKNKPINMSKFGAYMGMFSSAGRRVREPRYVVVKDLEMVRNNDLVHFVDADNHVSEKRMNVSLNVFDGMGLVSTHMAKLWTEDLDLNHDAIQFLIRAPYIKGLLVSFPFHLLANERGISSITDIYGTPHNIEDVDVILTESQFKMSGYYSSIEEHQTNSRGNNLNWYVTRTNPAVEKSNFFTSYQYLQVLKNDVDIGNLTKDTIRYIEDVGGLHPDTSLIYFTGDNTREDMDFSRIDNHQLKLLALNKKTAQDPYVRKYIIRTLNRKIKESYTGKIMVEGHYSFMMADPYALAEHSMGLPVKGLLNEGQFSSQYWLERNIEKVVAGRSPLTWRSELCVLDIVTSKEIKKWLSHLYSGVILNVFGNDIMKFADSDFDGDLVFTSNNSEMIKNAYGGIPVTYEKKPAPKDSFDYNSLPKYEMKSFGTKIGLVTNFSTTLSALLPFYDDGSKEYTEIINRLIVCRKLQGEQIDCTKGILVGDIPKWSKKIAGNELHNTLLLNKRPMFMRYLYQYKNKEFENHHYIYDVYSWTKWGVPIDNILSLEYPLSEQIKTIERYHRKSPLISGSHSVMENLSRFMVERVKEIKYVASNRKFDYSIYLSGNPVEDNDVRTKMLSLIREYNKIKKNLHHDDDFSNVAQVFDYIKNQAFKISYDLELLTDTAVLLCYRDGKNENFVHDIFADGILNNLMKKTRTFRFPVKVKNGDIEFCYEKYQIKNFNIAKET